MFWSCMEVRALGAGEYQTAGWGKGLALQLFWVGKHPLKAFVILALLQVENYFKCRGCGVPLLGDFQAVSGEGSEQPD